MIEYDQWRSQSYPLIARAHNESKLPLMCQDKLNGRHLMNIDYYSKPNIPNTEVTPHTMRLCLINKMKHDIKVTNFSQ